LLIVALTTTSLATERAFFDEHVQVPRFEQVVDTSAHDARASYDAATAIVTLSENGSEVRSEHEPAAARLHLAVPGLDDVAERLRGAGYTTQDVGAGAIRLRDGDGRIFMLRHGVRHYLDVIDLFVADVTASEDFYCGVLGLPRLVHNDWESVVSAGRVVVRLKKGDPPRGTESFTLAFHSGDLDSDVATMAREGVTLDGPRSSGRAGLTAGLRDPDGHRLSLYEPSPSYLDRRSAKVGDLVTGSLHTPAHR
jgi:catechol 2,3-dioxygenase-like lactoylglutathione lyase family enzyme